LLIIYEGGKARSSGILLPAEDKNVFAEEPMHRKIDNLARRENQSVVKPDRSGCDGQGFSLQESKKPDNKKAQRVNILQPFYRQTCAFCQNPKCILRVAAAVTYVLIKARPETLKGRDIEQKLSAWLQLSSDLPYHMSVILDVLKHVQRENKCRRRIRHGFNIPRHCEILLGKSLPERGIFFYTCDAVAGIA